MNVTIPCRMCLPGWDSLELVAKIHRFFEIGGIFVLLALPSLNSWPISMGNVSKLSPTADKTLKRSFCGRKPEKGWHLTKC